MTKPLAVAPETATLPPLFARWFESRGWSPRAHQLALLSLAQAGKSALLIAPTGAGKTLAGFLPGLIERRYPGMEKTGRQVTFSSDLIYNVLREHEPDHIMLRATYNDASTGLLDVARVAAMLRRIKGRILLKRLDRVSPLAVPVLLDIGKVSVDGEANEALLSEAADDLIAEATRLV